MTQLLWVAVPGGIAPSDKALIRVLVVPRLDAGVLSDFGLDDWPSTLRDTTVKVRVKTTDGAQTAFVGQLEQPAARSEVWRAFFGGAAGIVNPPGQQAPGDIVVDDTHATAGAVTDTHQTSIVELASPDDATVTRLRERITSWHKPDEPPVPRASRPPPTPPVPDFHQAVALLREHPAVLRELGLIFEVFVDAARLRVGDGTRERYVAVLPDTPLAVRVSSPWSQYDLAATRFWPAARANAPVGIRHGVLDLSQASLVRPQAAGGGDAAAPEPPAWAIATFDIDNAQLSLRQAARSLVDDPDRAPALPGLRSAGLQLIRPQRHSDLADRMASASRRAASEDDQHLTAEELTLGYRVDVRGEDSHWRSLCQRRVAYSVKEQDSDNVLTLGGSPLVLEEGHVKPFAATRGHDDSAARTLFADQVVLRWDGWSLVLPRMHPLEDRPHAVRNPSAALPYDFRSEYLRPGQQLGQPGAPDDRLPPLRFAGLYQMRVRIADIAGGGPRAQDVDGSEEATQEILYARHDPVRPPLLNDAPASFTPGAGIDHLVLRSDRGLSAAQFAAAEPRYASMERRTLQRPSVSFELAEQHRMFDSAGEQQTWQWARLALATDGPAGLADPAAAGVLAYVAAAAGGLDHTISDHSTWTPWPDETPKFLQLDEQTDADAPPVTLRWEETPAGATTLIVKLRKGEQAVLELSSRITAGMQDHFAWHDWLSHDEAGLAASIAGRNPAITPPRRIEVVHAVRRPAVDPVWKLPSATAARAEHATTAQLTPTFTSLDTDATGRIEISATWEDYSDEGHETLADRLVHAQTVDRGPPPTPLVRHEFGDTKHRTVHYTIRATSRYRHYFYADEPAAAFEAVRPQDVPVNVLSTSRPAPLTLLGAAPSFDWHIEAGADRVQRIRSPRVRIELARPWYQTGEGESLGVITAIADPPPSATRSSVTQIGRDPIVASPIPIRFPAAAALTAAGATRLTPREFGAPVDVVPHAVTRTDDYWYADIAISGAAVRDSYMPFVRLALARYQPDSLDDLKLSTILMTELVPLLPERRLTVERHGATVLVTLTGPGPNPPNRFEVSVETRAQTAGAHGADSDLIGIGPEDDRIAAWRALAQTPTTATIGATATVALPAPGRRARLRVRELEAFDASGSPADLSELVQRSVYIDALDIPPGWLAG